MSEHTHSSKTEPAAAEPATSQRTQWIAVAAYYRSEHRGFAEGQELEDWLEAEKEIDASHAREREEE
jgi:hypothetical protein